MVQLVKKMPPKALGKVFEWFWTIFGHVFFCRFLVYFLVFFGLLGAWLFHENASKMLKKHQRDHFLGVLDRFRWSESGFESFWRKKFFFIFVSFLCCFLVDLWSLWHLSELRKWSKVTQISVRRSIFDVFGPIYMLRKCFWGFFSTIKKFKFFWLFGGAEKNTKGP